MTQMIDAGKKREGTAVVDKAANRDAAKADAMVTPLTADDTRAGALADGTLIGDGDLQSGIDRTRIRSR